MQRGKGPVASGTMAQDGVSLTRFSDARIESRRQLGFITGSSRGNCSCFVLCLRFSELRKGHGGLKKGLSEGRK